MFLAESINAFQWLLLAVVVGSALLILLRGARTRDDAAHEESGENESQTLSPGIGRRVSQLEVQLHDYAREVEARMETRVAQLDQLISEADREIARLTQVLTDLDAVKTARGPDIVRFAASAESAEPKSARSNNPRAKREPGRVQMVHHLHDAGYTVPEIAHIVDVSDDEVKTILRAA